MNRHNGWVPSQHGASVMVLIPIILGVLLSQFVWQQLWLAAAWICAYLVFSVLGQWAKVDHSKRRAHMRQSRAASARAVQSASQPARATERSQRGATRTSFMHRVRANRYTPALVTYAAVTAILGVPLLVTHWFLWRWAVVFAPLVAIALFEDLHGRDRSWWSRFSTILASCLVLPVLAHLADTHPDTQVNWPHIWWATALWATYSLGSAPYVRTLIRSRGDRRLFALTVGWHLVALGASVWAVFEGFSPVVVAVWAVLALRAAFVPWHQAHGGIWTPKRVGLLEALLSVLAAASLLL